MRPGIIVEVSAADRARLEAIVVDGNSPQKHAWRARIVLLSADGLGTNAIMRQTGKSKTAVWRWQERFMVAGVAGLLRDKTRRSRIPPLGPEIAERVVALTQSDPPGEATHWTAAAIRPHHRRRQARASGIRFDPLAAALRAPLRSRRRRNHSSRSDRQRCRL
jgi:transposase